MRRFPFHRLLLMVVALLAFARLWYVSHRPQPAPAARPPSPGATGDATPTTPPAGESSPSGCRTLDRALEAALRAPDEPRALSDARRQLDACPQPPQRACELGPALASRAPLSAGESPLRGLLASLCERCPAGFNPCGEAVGRGLLETATGLPPDLATLRWSLEHAGPGTEAACRLSVGSALGSAAVTGSEVSPPVLSVLTELAPLCAKAGHLPAPVLHAAAAQQGAKAPGLAALATAGNVETGPVKPDQRVGPGETFAAFDRDVNTGVKLGFEPRAKRWDADGALRAEYAPTLKQVPSFQVRATGPGTLRAIIRTPKGMGLEDPERGFFFVNPTVCRFRGTGDWEICKPAVPLLDVDSVSVFPERAGVELKDLEIIGAR